MKKKIVSILLVATMIVAASSACGKEKAPDDSPKTVETEKASKDDYAPAGVTKKEYQSMTAQDLVDRIKDVENITEEEALEFVSTYAYVEYDDELCRTENITDEAMQIIWDAGGGMPNTNTFLEAVVTSENPNVRAYGFSRMGGLFGTSDAEEKMAEEALEKETDPVALDAALNSLANSGSNPYIAKFFIKMSEHEHPIIRKDAAIAIGNYWSIGAEGMVETIIKLMNDEDEMVADVACSRAGNLADDQLVEPLVTILNDAEKTELHGSCCESLVTMWFDYPFHEKTSEAAYRATMDYWAKTPRTQEDPEWTSLGDINHIAEDSIEEWKAKATYYNPDEICNIMKEIISDPEANSRARTEAMEAILNHGDDAQKEELKSIIEGLTDKDASSIQSRYANEIAE